MKSLIRKGGQLRTVENRKSKAMTNDKPPKAKPLTCNACGHPIWSIPMDPKKISTPGWRRFLFLDTQHINDSVSINQDGYAVYDNNHGKYTEHKCPARTRTCKHCQKPVKILWQKTGDFAVLDPEPNPGGHIVIRGLYAVHDPGFHHGGNRYLWHSNHGRAPSN